tara:strand:- start:631 stop:1239 length:609 start_codon:yes stop_codon:yes gene_type:complete
MKKKISRLIEKTKFFFNSYKNIILITSFIFTGVFCFKLFYDYQQEQKEIIYKTVDVSKFYSCGGYMFGLNQSPQDRDNNRYSPTSFVLYRASDEGRSEPYISNVTTRIKTDYLYFWTHSRYESYGRERYERPVYKLNRLTGKLHALKPKSTYACGLLDDFCQDYKLKAEGDYEILECNTITENVFDKEFNRRLDAYKQERKF